MKSKLRSAPGHHPTSNNEVILVIMDLKLDEILHFINLYIVKEYKYAKNEYFDATL
jgi:hypothetical protein